MMLADDVAARSARTAPLSKNARRTPRGAPDQPLPLPGCDLDRHEGIVAAPFHARERRTRKRHRQQGGKNRGRRCQDQLARPTQMIAGTLPHFGQRGTQLRRDPPCRDVMSAGAVPLQHLQWHEQLAAGGMRGERLEQAGDRVGETGMVAQRFDIPLDGGCRVCAAKVMRPDEAPSAQASSSASVLMGSS
jgi:hypothetical protein